MPFKWAEESDERLVQDVQRDEGLVVPKGRVGDVLTRAKDEAEADRDRKRETLIPC